ncbi:MAG: hypothetical protein AAF720_00180 [Pseudomonadota bacterium]
MDESTTGNQYALAMMKKRRAKMAGEVESFRDRVLRRFEQIETLDAAIKIFEPGFDPDSVKPIKHRVRSNLFKRGELSRLILGVLRKSEHPLSARRITDHIMNEMGFESEARPAITNRVSSNLNYQLKMNKTVKRVGEGSRAKWRIL